MEDDTEAPPESPCPIIIAVGSGSSCCEPDTPDLKQPLCLGDFINTLHDVERRIHEDIAKLRQEMIWSATETTHFAEGLASTGVSGLLACRDLGGATTCSISAVKKSMRRTLGDVPISLASSEIEGRSKGDEDMENQIDWMSSIRFRPPYGMADGEENMSTLKEVAKMIKEGVDVTDTLPSISARSTGQFPNQKSSHWTMDPQCASRLCFDILSLVVLMFELFYTPLSLTWSVKESTGRVIMVVTTMFWLTDMALSFFTAFSTKDGVLERSNCKVAWHYLKTWFCIDLSCVAGDIVSLLLVVIIGNASNAADFSNFLRVMKLARFLRVLGMVRVLRIMGQVNSFMEAHMSEAWRMMLKILQLTCVLVWIGHLVACCWYNIGRYAPKGDTGEQWVDTYLGLEPVKVRHHSDFYQYAVAYHWGLAQITLGAHDVNPVNTWERLFTVMCNLFGLLFGGTLVSILSTTLIDLREMNADKTKATRILKDFLMQYDVFVGIRMRALQHFDERTTQRTKILIEKDVAALEMLSKGFLRELRCALYEKHITAHPLLRAWSTLDNQCIRDICTHEAGLQLVLMLPHDELFAAGDRAKAAYYFMDGHLSYRFHAGGSPVNNASQSLDAGAWIAEAYWWCEWVHVGTLASEATPCKLLSVSAENILQAMLNSGEYRPVAAITRLYATAYHRCIAKATPDMVPTDLHVHYAGFADLVSSMPLAAHILIGCAAIKTVAPRSYYTWSGVGSTGLHLLEQEIWSGRSIVIMDGPKSVKRYVRLLLLILKDLSGNYLVEVADFKHDKDDEHHHKGRWVASGRLPGGKQTLGTLPQEGILYVLQRRFAQLEQFLGHLRTEVVDHTEEVEPSPRFQVDTIYSKTTCQILCKRHMLDLMDLYSKKVHLSSQHSFGNLGHHSGSAPRCPEKVYVLSGSEHAGIYAWLSPEEFKVLRGDPHLQEKWTELLKTQIPLPEIVSQAGTHGQFGVKVKPLQSTIAL